LNNLMEETDFDSEMEKMAVHLLTESQKQGVKLEEKIKVFEAVQPYFAARGKYKATPAPVNGNRRSFRDFKAETQ